MNYPALALMLLLLSGSVGYGRSFTETVAFRMAEVAEINAPFSVKVENFGRRCWFDGQQNETYCLVESSAYSMHREHTTVLRADAYADWYNKEIVIRPETKKDVQLIAHEVAHMKLFDEGIPSLENESYHHAREDFWCWEECLAESYDSHEDVCGGCRE
ncbi:MAG: hypothetical protein WC350_05885 [Candidatus Micrarchaeia archaeon]|jgi:hypothetical protein